MKGKTISVPLLQKKKKNKTEKKEEKIRKIDKNKITPQNEEKLYLHTKGKEYLFYILKGKRATRK